MAHTVTFKGNPVRLTGHALKPGDQAPQFQAVANDLSAVGLPAGKPVVLLSVPSLDTGVCDTEVRRFNQEAASLPGGVEILVVSCDLPFAQKRWCGAAGAERVRTASDFRGQSFGRAYGTLMEEGPLAGLDARAVFVVDAQGKIQHVEYVAEVTTEPNYAAALDAVRKAAMSSATK